MRVATDTAEEISGLIDGQNRQKRAEYDSRKKTHCSSSMKRLNSCFAECVPKTKLLRKRNIIYNYYEKQN